MSRGKKKGPGPLVVIGGAEDRGAKSKVLREFVRLAGGRRAAVSDYPQDLGLGIDEETAMVVRGTEFEVFGRGAVTVIDAGSMSYTSLPYVEEGEGISVFGVRVHVLSAGHKFDLANRRPVVEEGEAVKRGRVSESEEPKEPNGAGKPRAGK